MAFDGEAPSDGAPAGGGDPPGDPATGGAAHAAAPVEERQTTPFLVLQFFVFPMAIVAVCVTVFAIFGLVASEGKGPREHLVELRGGGGLFNHKRWQAAFALAGSIENHKDKLRGDAKFAADLVAAYEDSRSWNDPPARRYLALALGRLGDGRAVPALRRTLQERQAGDAEGLVDAIWALGTLGDPQALPELLPLASDDDAGLRKAAVHALGAFDDPQARAALVRALEDGTEDVRWNAALALARHADPAGVPVLRTLLDRDALAAVPGVTPEQAEVALEQAVAAAAVLRRPELRPALERLRDRDPNLKLRDAARRALDGLP